MNVPRKCIWNSAFFNRFLQDALRWGRLKSFFLFATIIGVMVGGVFFYAFLVSTPLNPQNYLSIWEALTTSLLYSYIAAIFLHLAICLHNAWKEWLPPRYRAPVLILTLGCAIVESSVFSALIDFWSNNDNRKNELWEIVPYATILAIFVSIMAVAAGFFFEQLLDRLETAQDELRQKEIEEHRLRKLKVEAELQALQAKINPHFLFNTLNSIASLITIDPSRAEEAIEKLSSLFRLTLKNSLTDQIPIIDSLTMVESYLDLEHLRFGKRLSYAIECDDSVSQVFLPALLIQPLVENAIKHGISPKVEGGHVSVCVRKSANTCVIEINDNGIGWQNKQSDSGHGLVNIKERLRLLFNEEWTMEIESNEGVKVIVTFPLEEK